MWIIQPYKFAHIHSILIDHEWWNTGSKKSKLGNLSYSGFVFVIRSNSGFFRAILGMNQSIGIKGTPLSDHDQYLYTHTPPLECWKLTTVF